MCRIAALVAGIVVAAGCGGADSAADAPARTEAERDSLIAESGLPGARGVRKALDAADAAEARAAALDSVAP